MDPFCLELIGGDANNAGLEIPDFVADCSLIGLWTGVDGVQFPERTPFRVPGVCLF